MRSNKILLITVFITAVIDMLGIGIIIPIIPALFYNKSQNIFGSQFDSNTLRWIYCILISIYSFMQFIGSPILGSLSDKFGRKKIILISLIGSSIGYSLFGLSIFLKNFYLLFLSRIIPGFFGGSLSVLYSTISDVSEEKEKPKNFALIGLAFAIGFILGPIIGGYLSDNTINSNFSLSTPFYFATSLGIINFIFVYFKFQNTNNIIIDKKISLLMSFKNIKNVIVQKQVRTIFSISFFNSLGFSFYFHFLSVFLFSKFLLSQNKLGEIYGMLGIVMIITQSVIIRIVSKYIRPFKIVLASTIMLSILFYTLIICKTTSQVYIITIFIAIFNSLNSPNLLTLISKQTQQQNQGEIFGLNQSMQSLAQTIPPIIVAIFGENLFSFPFEIGALSMLLTFLILILFYNQNFKLKKHD